MYGSAPPKVTRQTRGSKDNLSQDNAQLRPDTPAPLTGRGAFKAQRRKHKKGRKNEREKQQSLPDIFNEFEILPSYKQFII